MTTLTASDRRIIRAVLLVMGVPASEHAAHIEADFWTKHRIKRALRHYRQIYGSLTAREVELTIHST